MTDLPAYMKGVQLTGYGGLDTLVLGDDIPVPTTGPRDVLIEVSAASLNNTDINTRIGWYSKSDGDSSSTGWSGEGLRFPRIQGADVCGEVVAVPCQAGQAGQAGLTWCSRSITFFLCLTSKHFLSSPHGSTI